MELALEPFGEAAWRARLPEGLDAVRRRAVAAALRSLPGVVDGVVTERHALVVLRAGARIEDVATVSGAVAVVTLEEDDENGPRGAPAPREHVVRVRYDGADLGEVAAASSSSPAEVAALHAGRTYEVAVVGFLPGFAYLRELDPRLVLPRRSTPRTRVPALSVAIAGPYTGVYPFASAGGWHLLGTAVGFTPFDARGGAAMAPGDRVRFEQDKGETAP
jgi:UPF0271 protein